MTQVTCAISEHYYRIAGMEDCRDSVLEVFVVR